MKLATSDLVGFIKQRQFEQARQLKSQPTLALLMAGDSAPSRSFVRAKQRYGADIGIQVKVIEAKAETELRLAIADAAGDNKVRGMVVQLPLPPGFDTAAIVNSLPATKDVDALGANSPFEPPTAKGIMWLLGSLQLDLKHLKIVVVGRGQLVGQPVSNMLEASGAKVVRCDIQTKDLAAQTKSADVVITGVGRSGLITAQMLKTGAIVIDAGTTEAAGSLSGDADPALFDHPDIRVTPVPGGVGPLTVAALFDNLLIAASH